MNEIQNVQSYSKEQIDLIKSQIALDANEGELALFLYHCKKTGLDPLSKQIYFQKRGGKAVYITSIDGYRLIAARTNEHLGTDDSVFDNEDEPQKATVTVYRLVQGHKVAFTASARWNEYCPPKGQDHMWQKMPCTMLAKCAESLALRKAFPNELGGTYTKEELQGDEGTGEKRVPAQVMKPKPLEDHSKNQLIALIKSEVERLKLDMKDVSDYIQHLYGTGKNALHLTMEELQYVLAWVQLGGQTENKDPMPWEVEAMKERMVK